MGFSDPAVREKARATQTAKAQRTAELEAKVAELEARLAAPNLVVTETYQAPSLEGGVDSPSLLEQMLLEKDRKRPVGVPVEATGEMAKLAGAAEADGLAVQATTTEPDKYVVYDDWGQARRIIRTNLPEVMRGQDREGHKLHVTCPKCKGLHPESEWNPNACPRVDKVTGLQCPECGISIFPKTEAVTQIAAPKDPNVKQVEVTEAQKEKLAMNDFNEHIGTYHPARAKAMGIPLNPLVAGAR